MLERRELRKNLFLSSSEISTSNLLSQQETRTCVMTKPDECAYLDGPRESLGEGAFGVREEKPVSVLEGLELLGDDPREGGAEHAPCK